MYAHTKRALDWASDRIESNTMLFNEFLTKKNQLKRNKTYSHLRGLAVESSVAVNVVVNSSENINSVYLNRYSSTRGILKVQIIRCLPI